MGQIFILQLLDLSCEFGDLLILAQNSIDLVFVVLLAETTFLLGDVLASTLLYGLLAAVLGGLGML